mgnify:CR=1 FL=1
MKNKKVSCPNCKGNGFTEHTWETEKSTVQCAVCGSTGELDPSRHYKQTWDGKNYQNITSRTLYYGPLLDPEDFPNYRIHGI